MTGAAVSRRRDMKQSVVEDNTDIAPINWEANGDLVEKTRRKKSSWGGGVEVFSISDLAMQQDDGTFASFFKNCTELNQEMLLLQKYKKSSQNSQCWLIFAGVVCVKMLWFHLEKILVFIWFSCNDVTSSMTHQFVAVARADFVVLYNNNISNIL